MEHYQHQFIEFALSNQALLLGEFTLKSGRISPYFFNAGRFNTGKTISKLGQFYASAILASKLSFDMLFGPAYKGIPLVTAVAIALAEHHNMDTPYAFNRKEIKTHGDGGSIVGFPLAGRVLVIDDVITAGVTISETAQLLKDARCEMAGITISINRQERTQDGNLSAVSEVEKTYCPVISIIQLDDLIAYLKQFPGHHTEDIERIEAYKKKYAART